MVTEIEQVDLDVVRGDDATFDVVIRDAVGKVVNLTGGTLRFTARAKSSDAAAVITKTSAVGGQIDITDAPNGMAALKLVPADTSGLYAPKTLVYDFEFTDSGNKVSTVLPSGVLYIRRDITHA